MTNTLSVEQDIYIADADLAFRSAVAESLETEGYHVTLFSDGNSLVAATRQHAPGCIILDANMPGRSAIEVLGELGHRGSAPIVMTAGQADIETAVHAMKNGAHDFMSKPCSAEFVASRAREALAVRRAGQTNGPNARTVPGGDKLTPREREVLERIALGASNKEAGRQLGISPRTIEVHRARIMEKLSARNTADLVRIVYSAVN